MLKNINWAADDLRDFLLENFSSEILNEAKALISSQRVSEVYVEPGRVSARINGENKRSRRVVVSFSEFGSEVWDSVIDAIAERPLLTSQCYNNILPFSIKPFFSVHGVSLIGSIEELSATIDDEILSSQSVEIAAVLSKFTEHLLSSPYSICSIRGRNIEQIIHELREKRALKSPIKDSLKEKNELKEELPKESPKDFYEGSLSKIQDFSVRADELPASLLKRLDPVPLETPEIQVDEHLEAAYGRVARLSQSLARFLPTPDNQ